MSEGNEGIRRLARVSSVACYLVGAALALATTGRVLSAPVDVLYAPLGFPSLAHVAPWQNVLGRAIAVLPAWAASTALFVLGRAYRTVGAGRLFDVAVTRALRRFALAVLLASGLGMLAPTLTGLVLSAGTAPGQGRLVIQLSSTNVVGVVLALGMWTFARLLAEARRVKEENAEFV